MPKKTERTETEYLKGIIRQQKAEIKHLRKELKRTSKNSKRYKDLQEDLIDEGFKESIQAVTEEFPTCSKCGKGSIREEKIGHVMMLKCNTCDFSVFKKQ